MKVLQLQLNKQRLCQINVMNKRGKFSKFRLFLLLVPHNDCLLVPHNDSLNSTSPSVWMRYGADVYSRCVLLRHLVSICFYLQLCQAWYYCSQGIVFYLDFSIS